MNLLWVSTWNKRCGIADYSKGLFPAVQKIIQEHGGSAEVLRLEEYSGAKTLVQAIEKKTPNLIHFHHEYGLFGGKTPGKYYFPQVLRGVRTRLPQAKVLATAHTLIEKDYRYPVAGRGFQAPVRVLANWFLLPYLRKLWNHNTWSDLDRVIVHSAIQQKKLAEMGIGQVDVIPQYVNTIKVNKVEVEAQKVPTVLVFGFFTSEKGQDIAIRAFAELKKRGLQSSLKPKLVLGGGVRREEDQSYYDHCTQLIGSLGLSSDVEITGYVDATQIDELFSRATLVLLPFRHTTGSASLTQGLARGAAVLASDLPLNKEVDARLPGTLLFYKNEDVQSCAEQMARLLDSQSERDALSSSGLKYAALYNVDRTAQAHVEIYDALELRRSK